MYLLYLFTFMSHFHRVDNKHTHIETFISCPCHLTLYAGMYIYTNVFQIIQYSSET